MNSQSRMAKTLGCLVGAMTAGAALLHWIEPSTPPDSTRFAIQLRAQEMRDAVRPDTNSPRSTWQGVIIRADAESDPTPAAAHFRVTARGDLEPGADWRRQQGDGPSGFVEVVIDAPRSAGGRLASAQANTLLALLTELRRAYVPADTPIRIDEQSFADARTPHASVAAGHLRDLLRTAGITN